MSFLTSLIAKGGLSMLPTSHFAPNPTLDSPLRLETDLAKLPQGTMEEIIIPTSDEALRRKVEARGFLIKESTPNLHLLFRQRPDGALVSEHRQVA